MEIFTKENSSKGFIIDRVYIFIKLVINMKEDLKREIFMDKESC